MGKLVTGSEALARKLAGIPAEVLQALRPALSKRQGNPVGAAAWLIWDRCLALV